MRFLEFSPVRRPVLKISQQQQAQQAGLQKQKPATSWPQNKPATPAPRSVNVTPDEWKHQWTQKYLAARIAQDAQTVRPTEEDKIKAFMAYADAQSQADKDYEDKYGKPDKEDGWRDDHRWAKL